jgi:F-type H+-transporting ATPase subunit delta
MSVTRIATRYAKSLLDLAVEQGKLEQVNKDLQQLAVATQNRDLHLMLKSPIISNEKKNAALSALFSGKIDALTMGYLQLLVNKNREAYLSDIVSEFGVQYKALNKVTTVKVTTAVPMSDAVLEEVKARLVASGITNPNLDIQRVVDADIIGGFVLEFDSKRFDSSVASKLADLKGQFSKNLYIKEF